MTTKNDDFSMNGVATLSHLGVIKIEGDDAAKFIHGQLTQDFSLLDTNTARLAAFCSPKGRMLASFVGFKRSPTEIWLVCSRDILPTTLKRLSMFVMRAKARLTDVSEEFVVYGLIGSATKNIANGSATIWAKGEIDAASVVNLHPALGNPRQLWVAPRDGSAPSGETVVFDLWNWAEVRSGVGSISAPTVEAFVPQMINYESVGGVNFKKGCYPGQEVVARSQFRGTLKRRAFVIHADHPMAAGDQVFGPQEDSEPVGTVLQGAASPLGGSDAIVSVQLAAVEGGLFLGSHSGAPLEVLPLPYDLLEDV